MRPTVPAGGLQAVSPDSPTDGFYRQDQSRNSGLVVVVGRILILLVNLVLIPTPFILVGLCRAE